MALACFDPAVAQRRELLRIAFAREDRVEDGEPGDTGQIADDVMEVKVHLGEGFLNVLDMARSGAHEHVTVPQVRAQRADLVRRSE